MTMTRASYLLFNMKYRPALCGLQGNAVDGILTPGTVLGGLSLVRSPSSCARCWRAAERRRMREHADCPRFRLLYYKRVLTEEDDLFVVSSCCPVISGAGSSTSRLSSYLAPATTTCGSSTEKWSYSVRLGGLCRSHHQPSLSASRARPSAGLLLRKSQPPKVRRPAMPA